MEHQDHHEIIGAVYSTALATALCCAWSIGRFFVGSGRRHPAA